MTRFSVGSGILTRTVSEISGTLRDFVLTGRIASRDGFLQNVTPVVKLLGVFILVGMTVATRNVVLLAGFFVLSLVLARSSKIPLRLHVSRWMLVVVFSVVVVLPQLLLMDGPPIVSAFGLTVSVPGVRYVLRFTLRVAAAVSLLSVLTLTTNFHTLLGAFRDVRLPEPIILIVAITYRYVLLFFAELNRMVLAQQSRTFKRMSVRESWRRLGTLLGTFFLRTIERGERVQLAARARGGGQSMQAYNRSENLTLYDYVFGIVVTIVLTAWVVISWVQ